MMRSSLSTVRLVGLGLALALNACWAQVQTQPQAPTNSRNIDEKLISCMIIDNQAEVELSEFAAERASRDNVKAFANQMKDGHQRLLQKLKSIDPNNPAITGTQASQVTSGAPAGGDSSMLQLKKEVAAECLKGLKTELSSKPADEFDRCYLGQQVGAHMQMLAMLNVFERHASPELAPVIQESTQAVETHLNHAKRILQGVEAEVARAATTSTQRQ